MPKNQEMPTRNIVDREMLMRLRICPACNRKFNLGEPVVRACGVGLDPAQWVHEDDAVFDPDTGTYVVRSCAEDDR